MLSPARTPFDVRIISGDNEIACVLAEDKDHRPIWQRGAAPPLSPTINTSLVSNSTVPPEQGLMHTIEGTEGGAGAYYNAPGRYSFAESMYTRGHRPMLGPEVLVTTLSGGGALNGVVADMCEHNSTTYIAAGTKVYYWDTAATQLVKTAGDPAGNVKITAIQSFQGVLIVWMDSSPLDIKDATGKPYEFSLDNGATWFVASGSAGLLADQPPISGKYSAIKEQRSPRPLLEMVHDPNTTYDTEDPRDASLWDTGSKVGDNANYDHFTSVLAAPNGEMLYGKEVGWRSMDAFGNVDMLTGRVQPDAGLGTENFAWPVIMNGRVYAVARDYDICEYTQGSAPRFGFGPKFHGRDVPEMQKAVAALATDESDTLYVALAGSEGYVMEGTYVNGEWRYFGSLIKLGQAINRMWTASYALASNKNMWLWIAPTASPYIPYRALIPRGDYESDTDARYASAGNIRFGYVDAGQPQITKILAQSLPTTKNLLAATRTLQLLYRLDGTETFTSLNTFTVSPQPTTLVDTYYPGGTNCKRWEIKATFVNAPNTEVCALESIMTLVYRRPLRLDTLDFTIMAETGIATSMGGNSLLSAQGLKELLWDARNAIVPPTVVRDYDGLVWTVDIRDVEETWVKKGDGKGHALAYRVSCLQLPTITSINQATTGTVIPGGAAGSGIDVQEGLAGAGVTVVTAATKLNFDSTKFDVQAPGGGEAFITLLAGLLLTIFLSTAGMTEVATQTQEDISFAGMTEAASVA